MIFQRHVMRDKLIRSRRIGIPAKTNLNQISVLGKDSVTQLTDDHVAAELG